MDAKLANMPVTAGAVLFSTEEIVARILSNVSGKDILAAEAVCKLWKRTIYNNATPYKALAFEKEFGRMSPAGQRVFGTREIFETIMFHLPMKDLLLAQAVCRRWRLVILTRDFLLKSLFFEPASNEVALFHDKIPSDDGFERNLPAAPFYFVCPPYFPVLGAVRSFEILRRSSQPGPVFHAPMFATPNGCLGYTAPTRIFLNPLLLEKFEWFRRFFKDGKEVPEFSYYFDLKTGFDLSPAARRPEASWRRMLITQPPLAGINALIDGAAVGDVLARGTWGSPIRMGLLRKMMARAMGNDIKILGTEQLEVWRSGSDLQFLDAKCGLRVVYEEENDSMG